MIKCPRCEKFMTPIKSPSPVEGQKGTRRCEYCGWKIQGVNHG